VSPHLAACSLTGYLGQVGWDCLLSIECFIGWLGKDLAVPLREPQHVAI
jgi:hypothetical protein